MKIAISGTSGSGKSVVSRHLVEKHGYTHVSTGEICRTISRILYDSDDKTSLNKISLALRGIEKDILINSALRGISSSDIVFDSIRYASDIPIMSSRGFQTWRIDCPVEECVRRLQARGQIITAADLLHPSEVELSAAQFDVVIPNGNISEPQLQAAVDNQLKL